MALPLPLNSALLVVLALALAPPARANTPPASNSISPAFIRVVGSTAGVPDTVSGKFIVTVRDLANNPVAGADVRVDFSACPDIRIASDQLNPNYTVDCASPMVGVYTNADGIAAFTILGNSWEAGVHSGISCARIYADGVLLSSPSVAAFDLNGMGGVTGADLSVLLGDILSASYRGRSDFDQNGSLTGADLSAWLGVIRRGGSSVTGAACP